MKTSDYNFTKAQMVTIAETLDFVQKVNRRPNDLSDALIHCYNHTPLTDKNILVLNSLKMWIDKNDTSIPKAYHQHILEIVDIINNSASNINEVVKGNYTLPDHINF